MGGYTIFNISHHMVANAKYKGHVTHKVSSEHVSHAARYLLNMVFNFLIPYCPGPYASGLQACPFPANYLPPFVPAPGGHDDM